MELAATALVAAALEEREEEESAKRTADGEDELSSGEDESESDGQCVVLKLISACKSYTIHNGSHLHK